MGIRTQQKSAGLVAPGARLPTSSNLSTGADVWTASGTIPTTASATPTANVLHYVPLDVAAAFTVTAMGLEVVTAGSGGTPVVRLGIYSADGQGWPGTLLQDAGTVSAAAAGVVTVTGLSVALAPGRYWLAAVSQGATLTQPALRASGGALSLPAATAAEAMTATGLRSSLTNLTGALPASASGGAGLFSGTNLAPRILVRSANAA